MNNWFKRDLSASRGFKKELNKNNLFILIFLFTLLPLLAILQYYWLGQLSEGEKARMQSNIRISLERFAEDFDFELTRILSGFKEIEADNINGAAIISAKLKAVRENLINPGLIKEIYLVQPAKRAELIIYQLVQKEERLKEITWPDKFEYIKKMAGPNLRHLLPTVLSLSLVPQLRDIPLVVINMIPSSINLQTEGLNTNFLIIELSRQVITNELIPLFSRRYFTFNNEKLYDTAIIKGDSLHTVFFMSTREPASLFIDEAEFSVGIGNWRLDEYMVTAARVVLRDSMENINTLKKVVKKSDEKRFTLEIRELDSTVQKESYQFSIAKSEPWFLYIKHVAGNLDDIVGQARNRNLLISYIILVFLGLSIAFVYRNSLKAQKLARQQIEFVAGLTHELRTPLATIRSAAENIKDGLINDPHQIKQYGSLIYNEDQRLTQMIEQTLYFSGISFNDQSVQKESVDINKLLKEISIANRDYDIHIRTKKQLKIEADYNALKMAINNLVSNAVKYGGNGALTIKVKKTDDQHVEIQVADNGTGIPKEELPFIFDLFYRGSKTKREHIQGSGIGLSLVKKIVAAHNGHIAVQSTMNSGTIFTIILPVYKK